MVWLDHEVARRVALPFSPKSGFGRGIEHNRLGVSEKSGAHTFLHRSTVSRVLYGMCATACVLACLLRHACVLRHIIHVDFCFDMYRRL